MKALAIHRFCNMEVRIIVEVLEPATETSAVWDQTDNRGIEVVCPIKYHYRMIGRRYFHYPLSMHALKCHLSHIYHFQKQMKIIIGNITNECNKCFDDWV